MRSNRARSARRRFSWAGAVNLEIGVEVPDQLAHTLLGGAVQIGERIQLVHQPFRMDPAQRVSADGELPGIVTQHDGIAQKTVRMDAAPLSPFGGDLHRVLNDRQTGLAGETMPSRFRCACQAA